MTNKILMISGHSGTGKTTLATKLLPLLNQHGSQWILLDKDVLTDRFSSYCMKQLTGDSNDRDSPEFSKYIRDLEYDTLFDIGTDMLKQGLNLILCAPFGKELKTENDFDEYQKRWQEQITICWLHLAEEEVKKNIISRNHIRDRFKLSNWHEYVQRRYEPLWLKNKKEHLYVDAPTSEIFIYKSLYA